MNFWKLPDKVYVRHGNVAAVILLGDSPAIDTDSALAYFIYMDPGKVVLHRLGGGYDHNQSLRRFLALPQELQDHVQAQFRDVFALDLMRRHDWIAEARQHVHEFAIRQAP